MSRDKARVLDRTLPGETLTQIPGLKSETWGTYGQIWTACIYNERHYAKLRRQRAKETAGRAFLVLWKYEEAERLKGYLPSGGDGKHSDGLSKGDRVFVWATKFDELYTLGAIQVERSGKNRAEGKSLYGPFRIIPLKSLKWKLRFESSASTRLSHDAPLAMQVRSRRQPTVIGQGMGWVDVLCPSGHDRCAFWRLSKEVGVAGEYNRHHGND